VAVHPRRHSRGPVVLDFDGVLVDASPCWSRVLRAMFAQYGHHYSDAYRARLSGHHPGAAGALLAELIGRPDLAVGLSQEVMSRALAAVSEDVVSMPGAFNLVRLLHDTRALAVASNSPRIVVERALERTGMLEAFSVVVGSDDVMRPKPAPDVYVRACELLGCTGGSATAIEASMPGVASARGAGIYVIAVTDQPVVQSAADESYLSLHDPRLLGGLMACTA
jgi:HAD superfamily hydrolase (TIGR01509 family)